LDGLRQPASGNLSCPRGNETPKIDPANSWAALQGFGNVAQYAAIGFIELLGGKVACVSYWDRDDNTAYTISHKDGIDPYFLQKITDRYGSIHKDKAREAGYIIERATLG
jgi:glutamate dehydrogenase (NAD(P)+)